MSNTQEVAPLQIMRDPVGKAFHIWQEYEHERYNFAELWAMSQVNAPREATRPVKRLQWVRVLENDLAAKSWIAGIQAGYMMTDQQARREFCQAIFRGLDSYLASYFGCEYMPFFLRFYANRPSDEGRPYSVNWHCDAGPRKHLKLLLYLNDSRDSDGNTAFLDYETTMRLDETGYLFCALDQRIDDLAETCATYGIPHKPIQKTMRAGEGVLFEPSCIMHRAVWPTKGVRYLAQVCILPSPVPWHDACTMFDMPFTEQFWRRFDFVQPEGKA